MTDFNYFVAENKNERDRLLTLTSRLTNKELGVKLPNGWTLAMTLSHLAFWDLTQANRLKNWIEKGEAPTLIKGNSENDALAVLAAVIPPQETVKLVNESAEAIDRELEKLDKGKVENLMKMGFERMLRRSLHRKTHLDQIEKTLEAK
jgi:hypothetical protein